MFQKINDNEYIFCLMFQLKKIESEQEIQEEIEVIQDALANVSLKR